MYGSEDSLEMEIATHSSILAWRIPWTEEPGRLQSMGLQRVEHDLTMKTTTTKYVYIPMYINISMWTHTYTQRIGRMVLICVCSPQKSLMRLVCLHDGGSCSKIQHFRQPHLIGLQTLSGLFIPHLHFLLSWKKYIYNIQWLPGSSDSKESACSEGDPGSIPGLGRSPGEENGNALQYSCLENPMDKGAWQAAVHGVAKSWTWLIWLSMQSQGCFLHFTI